MPNLHSPSKVTKSIYLLEPAWDDGGDYSFHFIDDRRGLFEIDRFETTDTLLPRWTRPSLQIYRRGEVADVYYCAAGYFFFSARARDALDGVLGSSVEWLPSKVERLGCLWILHPLRSLALGNDAEVTRNEISENITVISRYTFAERDDCFPHAFFVKQAPGTAASDAGFVYPMIHFTDVAIHTIEHCALSGIRGRKVFERFEPHIQEYMAAINEPANTPLT